MPFEEKLGKHDYIVNINLLAMVNSSRKIFSIANYSKKIPK